MSEDTISPKSQFGMYKIEWGERGVALFADNVTVQYDGEVFRVAFYQINPPLRIEGAATADNRSPELGIVTANPIANLILPKQLFENTIRLFQRQLDFVNKTANDPSNR
jgi:hypothetical protein